MALHHAAVRWLERQTPAPQHQDRSRGQALPTCMQALRTTHATPNRYERVLGAYGDDSDAMTRFFAEASVLTRLRVTNDQNTDAINTVLSGVAAPLLVAFTLWQLQLARSLGLPRLFFLSREGQILFELANRLNEMLAFGLELRYLCVSRHALNRVLLTEPSRANLDNALTHSENDSLRVRLNRIGLTPETLAEELTAIGLTEEHWRRRLSSEENIRLLDILESASGRAKLIARAFETRRLVERYLEAEGVLDDLPIGFVDTTGVGSQFRTLNLIRIARTGARTEGFLVVRSRDRTLSETGFPSIHSYLGDHQVNRGRSRIPGLIQMLEVFANADHGTVLGYREVDGKVEPIFDPDAINRGPQWEASRLREPIFAFVDELSRHREWVTPETDLRSGIVHAFSAFWTQPTRAEAQAWGSFRFELGSAGQHVYAELAPRLRVSDLYAVWRGRGRSRLGWHAWQAGALHRSPLHVRLLHQIFRRLSEFFRTPPRLDRVSDFRTLLP